MESPVLKTTKTTFAVGYIQNGEMVPIMPFGTMELCGLVMQSQIFSKDLVLLKKTEVVTHLPSF